MKKQVTERCRFCIIVLGILLYLIIMFPPVNYKGLGRIYAILNWSGDVIWTEIFIEIAAALVVSVLVFIFYPMIKKDSSISD